MRADSVCRTGFSTRRSFRVAGVVMLMITMLRATATSSRGTNPRVFSMRFVRTATQRGMHENSSSSKKMHERSHVTAGQKERTSQLWGLDRVAHTKSRLVNPRFLRLIRLKGSIFEDLPLLKAAIKQQPVDLHVALPKRSECIKVGKIGLRECTLSRQNVEVANFSLRVTLLDKVECLLRAG